MDVTSILILVVVAWLAFYVLTTLMAQYRQELLDEWRRQQADKQREQAAQAAAATDATSDEGPARARPPAAAPDQPVSSPDRP